MIPVPINRLLGPPAPLIYYSGELQQDANWPPLPSRRSDPPAESRITPKDPPSLPPGSPISPPVLDEEIVVLRELQQEFDDEDSRLRREREVITNAQPLTFICAVCTDEFPEDFVARVPECGHGFCRECLKAYAVGKLEEHRFPILCPSCVVDTTGKEPGSKSSMVYF